MFSAAAQKKRSRLRVNADRVQFLDRRDDRPAGDMPPEGGQPGGYSQYNRGPQNGYGGGPQGGYGAQRGPQGRPQQYRQQSAPPAPEDVPQMPPDDPPFETVEGVDDDIPF